MFYKFNKSSLHLTLTIDTCKKQFFIEEREMIQELSHLQALRQPNQKFWRKILTPFYITVIFTYTS